MATQFVNATPHPVTLFVGDVRRTFEPSGFEARVYYDRETEWANGIPLVRDIGFRVVDLPAPQPNVVVIVAGMVFEACPDRKDLAAPVQPVRQDGRVIGCKMLRIR